MVGLTWLPEVCEKRYSIPTIKITMYYNFVYCIDILIFMNVSEHFPKIAKRMQKIIFKEDLKMFRSYINKFKYVLHLLSVLCAEVTSFDMLCNLT